MKEDLLKGLTEEQVAKIKACKDQEEMLKENNIYMSLNTSAEIAVTLGKKLR